MKFCPLTRPYCSVEDMDGTIVEDWNDTVAPHDKVFFLGDFSFHKPTKLRQILKALNGEIHMIYGNHDQTIRNNKDIRDMFASTQEYLEIKDPDSNTKICLFHYGMEVWNKSHHGSIHLHGHSHGELPDNGGRRFDVGWDVKRKLFSIEEIMEMANARPVVRHHQKDCMLTIVRGAPGAGKSTFVENEINPKEKEAHFEADMFFYDEDGNYTWDFDELSSAHAWCIANVKDALRDGKNTVVSNTSIKPKDVAKYLNLAREMGVALKIVDVRGHWKNIHGCAEEKVEEMRGNFKALEMEFVQKHYMDGNSKAKYDELSINTGGENYDVEV